MASQALITASATQVTAMARYCLALGLFLSGYVVLGKLYWFSVPFRGIVIATACYTAGSIAVMMPFLIWRLLEEERFLARKLPGYTEYQERVRYRLVPFVW